MKERWLRIAVIAALGGLYLVLLAAAGTDAFWIGDEAVKLLELRAMQERGASEPALAWAGQSIDPSFTTQPLPPPFTVLRDGKLYAQYLPFFPLISSVFYAGLGSAGLYVLPWLSTLGLLGGVWKLGTITSGNDTRGGLLAVVIAGLATPLWFYAVTFWEHAPAVCLATWAVVVSLERRPPEISAALAAASVWLREEMLLFAVLLGIATMWRSSRRLQAGLRIAVTTAVVLAPMPWLLWKWTGSPWGLHASANAESLGQHLASRFAAVHDLWLAGGTGTWPTWLVALPAVAVFALSPLVGWARSPHATSIASALGAIVGVASLAGAFAAESPIAWLLGASGILAAAPALVIGCAADMAQAPNGTARRGLALLSLAYGAAYTLAAPSIATGGLHWGNRFLLPLYPMLAVLAAAALIEAWSRGAMRRVWALPVALALATSLAIQFVGFDLLARKRDFSRRLERAVRESPERAILTDSWWIGGELHAFYEERPIFLVRDGAAFNTLRTRLLEHGIREVLLIQRAKDEASPSARVIDDDGLDFFSVVLRSRQLAAP